MHEYELLLHTTTQTLAILVVLLAGNMLKTIVIGVLAAAITLILISISIGLSVYCCHRKKISNHSELFTLYALKFSRGVYFMNFVF